MPSLTDSQRALVYRLRSGWKLFSGISSWWAETEDGEEKRLNLRTCRALRDKDIIVVMNDEDKPVLEWKLAESKAVPDA